MPSSDDPIALISDIHGNVEALLCVLEDISSQGIRRIINLGDVVGYGPDPELCIDLVEQYCIVNLCGNHDYAVLNEPDGFNPIAAAAVEFVRKKLRPRKNCPEAERRWEFLEGLDTVLEADGFEAMHASPRHPITEYVLPSDPQMDPFKIEGIFSAMTRPVAFVGHTHFPGVIEEGGSEFLMPDMFDQKYSLVGKRLVVNVGSVGQPRDRDVRSCYVIFDGQEIRYRRVEYDIESTVRKVRDSGGLHEICGLRLREGR